VSNPRDATANVYTYAAVVQQKSPLPFHASPNSTTDADDRVYGEARQTGGEPPDQITLVNTVAA
jgi:hypothetical protein